ncbi:MAG TPA: M28 family peptidase [Longimicrobiaceae bacterium]|nr:M28 family peptidase [Longimicrobiaceae bacterium]
MKIARVVVLFTVLTATACSAQVTDPQPRSTDLAVDSARLVEHVRFLAAPEREGRATGSPGNAAAREYVAEAFREVGLTPVAGEWLHAFGPGFGPSPGAAAAGINLLGLVRGREQPDRFIVVTAHYDHLGQRGNLVFHGADDNASGTAALIELARHFVRHTPRHSILFAALDAEEQGLLGARAFVAAPPCPLEAIALNVNLDMVSRNEAGELYAAGTYHYPTLAPLVAEVARTAPVRLLTGHDEPAGRAGDDWTHLSDHGAFHALGIPFLYFGVEDHAD